MRLAAGLLVVSGLTITACGSTNSPKRLTSHAITAPTGGVRPPGLTAVPPTQPIGTAPTSGVRTLAVTPRPSKHPTSTAPSGPSFAELTGTYAAGTADGGWLYIRSDGASRFRAPDTIACPTCITASAPIATLDFSLQSISSSDPGGLAATGTITATSDPAWAKQLSPAATVGAPISLTVTASRQLTLSVLPGNDVLTFASPNPDSFGPPVSAAGAGCSLSGPSRAAETVPVDQVCSSLGAPHFGTPQAAMTYLASAWNTGNVQDIDYVTDPDGRQQLDSMAAVMINLQFKSCTPNPAGDYTCYFSHDIIPSTSPTTYPNPMNYPAGEAVFTVAPAQTPGWYLTNVIHCG